MAKLLPEMRRRASRYLRRADGSVTVEFVLWIPIFLILFAFMVDTAMIFNRQTEVLRVVQDANRRLSIASLKDTTACEDFVKAQLLSLGITATVSSQITTGVVRTIVRVPVKQLEILGIYMGFDNLTVEVASDHMIENWEPAA